jgi:NhaP-type Na+/H+ and K+/H+ antiporter
MARRIGIIALAAILFEGGLNAGFAEIRPVLRPGLMLAMVGTILTAVLTGFAAVWLLDLDTLEGMLVGATLAATDGAAIFALLRGSTLRRRLARTLEAEAGFNDPVAILLVIGFIEWIEQPGYGIADMALLFARQLSIGLLAGLAVGAAAVWAFRRVTFGTAGLYPVASTAAAALAFGAAETLHGSGFLAVYLAGLVLGARPSPRATRSRCSTRGWRGSPRSGSSSRSGCSSSRAASTRSGSRRAGSRSCSCWSRGRWPWPWPRHSIASARPSGSRSAGPGCAAACRSCSRPSR